MTSAMVETRTGSRCRRCGQPHASTAGERNCRAVHIARQDGAAVVRAAQSESAIGTLVKVGAPAALLGSLVQTREVPASWAKVSAWTRGPAGVQGVLPRLNSPHGPPAMTVVRAGDPEWTWTAGLLASTPEIDGDGEPLAAVLCAWLGDVPINDEGLSALTMIVEDTGLGEHVEPFRPGQRGNLPALQRGHDARNLPSLPTLQAEDRAPYLPRFEPGASGCPSWLLGLFDRAGGRSLAQGRGAPWALRLFIGALLHVRVTQRTGLPVALTFPVKEVAAWLHPGRGGWSNRRRDWYRLPEALAMLGTLRVPIEVLATVNGEEREFRPVALVSCPDPPPEWRGGDARVTFDVRVPAEAAYGARIDWPALCRCGAKSAAEYRLYLALAAVMHRTAFHGAPITRRIGAPELNAHGRPKRKPGGALVRSRKVLIEHPKVALVRTLTDRDLARFIGFDPEDRRRRFEALCAVERLNKDHVIDVEHVAPGRVRIFGPHSNEPEEGSVSCPDGSGNRRHAVTAVRGSAGPSGGMSCPDARRVMPGR